MRRPAPEISSGRNLGVRDCAASTESFNTKGGSVERAQCDSEELFRRGIGANTRVQELSTELLRLSYPPPLVLEGCADAHLLIIRDAHQEYSGHDYG